MDWYSEDDDKRSESKRESFYRQAAKVEEELQRLLPDDISDMEKVYVMIKRYGDVPVQYRNLICLSGILAERRRCMLMAEERCSQIATDWRQWRKASNDTIILALRMYSRSRNKTDTVNFVHKMVYRERWRSQEGWQRGPNIIQHSFTT